MATDEDLMALAREAVSARDVQAARRLLAELEREAQPDPAAAARQVAQWLTRWTASGPWQSAGSLCPIVAVVVAGVDQGTIGSLAHGGPWLVRWLPQASARTAPAGVHPAIWMAMAMGTDDDELVRVVTWAAGTQDQRLDAGLEIVEYDGLDLMGREDDVDIPGLPRAHDGWEAGDDEELDEDESVGVPPVRSVTHVLDRWLGTHLRMPVVQPWLAEDTWTVDMVALAAEVMPHDGLAHLVVPARGYDPEAMVDDLRERLGRTRVQVLR